MVTWPCICVCVTWREYVGYVFVAFYTIMLMWYNLLRKYQLKWFEIGHIEKIKIGYYVYWCKYYTPAYCRYCNVLRHCLVVLGAIGKKLVY